jgi:hypothetical protein
MLSRPKVRLHPNLAGMYRQNVAALEQALADPEIKAEAAEIVRSQIDQITLTPDETGGLAVELYGDLARIMPLSEAGERKHQRPGGKFRGVDHAEDCRWLRGLAPSLAELEWPDSPHGISATAKSPQGAWQRRANPLR